jgi:hypothetical protein
MDVSSFNTDICRSDDGCTAFWGMKNMDYVKFGKTGEVAAFEHVPRGVSGL